MNENAETLDHQAVYGKRQPVTTGLTWGYYGGRWGGVAVTAGTLALTNAATNYIVVLKSTGAISVSTASTNWDNTELYSRVYKLTTAGSVVTATEDHRVGVYGVMGFDASIVAANEATDTTCFVTFVTTATGQQQIKTNANLTFNASTGALGLNSGILTTTSATFTFLAGATTNINLGAATTQFNFGEAISTAIKNRIGGTWTGSSGAGSEGLRLEVDITGFAGNTSFIAQANNAGTITTQGAAETISNVCSWRAVEPNITIGAGDTVDDASTVLITGAPTEGTRNWALWSVSGSNRFGGTIYVNDTSNANSTIGITINQGANDNQAFTIKSSDVATVLTTITTGADVETDDYFSIFKFSATLGGAHIYSLAESTATEALMVETWCGAPATTDTSASLGAMCFFGGQHDGANADVDMAANSNLVVWGEIDSANARLTRMLLKADDGELHLGNTTLVALDGEDDIRLVRAMQKESASDGLVLTEFDNPFDNYDMLHRVGLAGEKDKHGFFLFPLQARLAAHEGAMWQMHLRHERFRADTKTIIENLTGKIKQLENNHA